MRNKKILIGTNLMLVAASDIELQCIYKLSKHHEIGIAGGYDYNYLQDAFTDTYPLDSAKWALSVEEESNPASRYWYGSGFAFRLLYNYIIAAPGERERFVSFEALYKIRDYSNLSFCPGGITYSESGDQNIYGFSCNYGANYNLGNTLLLQLYIGAGVRYLDSKITRGGHNLYGIPQPETHLDYELTIPSFQLGLVILVKV